MTGCRNEGDRKMKKYSPSEWENICRRCGKCCLIKLEDEDTGGIYYTDVVCRYFDEEKMCCSVYDKRCELVPSCLRLSPDNVDKLDRSEIRCPCKSHNFAKL